MMSNRTSAIVIGAGAVGVCSAYYLAERGLDVTLVDRGDVCAGCSYGNSGLLVPSHSVPLAAPGVIWRALRWMAKPDSPFYIRPRPSPSLVSWLWKFRAACSEENVERAMPVLRDLTTTGVELFRELDEACESDFGLGTAGVSYVYRTEEGLANGRKEAAHIATVGLQAEELDREGVREFAGLETTAIGGMLHPYDGHVTPGKYVHAVAEAFERGGGRIERHTAVSGFETDGRRVSGVVTDGGVLEADEIVLAAGSWSPAIAARLGVRLPIQPAKGYSVRFRRPENAPEVPLILGEARVAMTPMGDTMRIAGTLEMAGMDLSIDQRRLDAVRESAGLYFPTMDASRLEFVEEWAGLRPLSPDGLALLGRWPSWDNLTIAAGHGTMGVSTSPASGKLVAQIITGEEPLTDLAPLDPTRFG